MTVRRDRQPRRKAAPPPPALTCEIAFWRGYVKAGFYASTYDAEGEEVAVAESPLFRAHGNGLPERDDKAVAAFEKLRSQLQTEGWTHVGRGQHWFSDRFELPVKRTP